MTDVLTVLLPPGLVSDRISSAQVLDLKIHVCAGIGHILPRV